MKKKTGILQNRILYPLYAALLSMLAFLISLAALGILGYSNDTILRSDLNVQYIAFIQMFLRVLKGEGSLWYTFSAYLGSGAILTYAYYAFSPFNLLYLIESVSIPAMTAVIIVLKLGTAAASFQLFIQKTSRIFHPATLLFAMSYALCGYAVTMHYHIMWLDALYTLPIIILFIVTLIDTGSFIGLVPAYAYLFITNFYMGFMVGIFSAVVFVLYLLYREDIRQSGGRRRMLLLCLKYAFAVLLAVGLCAILLIPTAYFLYSHMAADNAAFSELRATLPDLLNSMFIGQMQTLDTQVPLLYCGLPALILVPFYFMSKKISRREKIMAGIAAAYLLLCTLLLPLYKFMHAFDYPNMYGYRFAFLMVFLMLWMACRVLPHIEEIPFRHIVHYLVFLAVFYSFMISLQKVIFSDVYYRNSQNEFLLNTVFLVLWGAILYRCISCHAKTAFFRSGSAVFAAALILMTAELSINAYLCISKEEHSAVSEDVYNQWYYSEKDAVDSILEADSSFYRIHTTYDESPNAAGLFGYHSLSTFSSSDDYPLRQALSHLGIATSNRFISGTGYTTVTDMLFSGKYRITLMPAASLEPGITKDTYTPAEVAVNPYSLPLGYMSDPQIIHYQPGDDPFYNQMLLLYCLTGQYYEVFTPVPQDKLKIEYENMAIANSMEYVNFYHLSDYLTGGIISFSAPVRDGMQFMACFTQPVPAADSSSPSILAQMEGINESPYLAYGAIAKGTDAHMYDTPHETVMIYFSDGYRDYYCNNMYFYYYDSSVIPAAYEDLSAGGFRISHFEDDYIQGTVTATKERPVFLTTLPYDSGWHAYVDGTAVPTYPVLEDAFLSLVLTPGEHQITLEYVAQGSLPGAVITLVSFIIFILLSGILFLCRKRKSEKN